jgi:hypothetical protein
MKPGNRSRWSSVMWSSAQGAKSCKTPLWVLKDGEKKSLKGLSSPIRERIHFSGKGGGQQ